MKQNVFDLALFDKYREGNSLIIENPGSVIVGKQQMLKGGISIPRNRNIMKMFNLIRVGERAGSGVPNIYDVWNGEGWIPPDINEQYDPDRTILTLSFTEKQAAKTSGKNKRERANILKHRQISKKLRNIF